MFTQYRPQMGYGQVMPILNYNIIREENKGRTQDRGLGEIA